jgi:hypothetical protein
MIRFTLRCDRDHEFEAWFRSSADYEKSKDTACPLCGSEKVEKAPMAPALGRSARHDTADRPDRLQLAAAPDPRQTAIREALKEMRKQVTENADYVGDRFAEEARKMHYKESEPRAIYGEATGEEATALAEEGIEFQPLPRLPEDGN